MQVIDLEIPDVKILVPKRFGDARGVFCETFSRRVMDSLGLAYEWVQDNHSVSAERGTVRGLHFQIPPYAQTKLIRVTRGSILDVAVDIRRASPTFGKHVKRVLSAENWEQMLVPAGFAHAFCTLEAGTEVIYKVTDYYAPQHDRGILWNDPAIGIEWPVGAEAAVLSAKDRKLPLLRDAEELF